jgi:hypothetical protein
MRSVVQQLAEKLNMSFGEFVGELRKRGCGEPTATKIWRGEYEDFKNFSDNDMALSTLRQAANMLKVGIGQASAQRPRQGISTLMVKRYLIYSSN